LLRIAPGLEPGATTHLGRSIPFTFFKPFTGIRTVGWLPGFCQLYRRQATVGRFYDEDAVVEDRDYSMAVGEQWRLVLCGDLQIAHCQDEEARHDAARQTWRAAFGLGRSFAKRRRSIRDYLTILHVLAGEFVIDVLLALRRPSLMACRIAIMRVNGYVSGLASVRFGQ
jgi:hypothetical protein